MYNIYIYIYVCIDVMKYGSVNKEFFIVKKCGHENGIFSRFCHFSYMSLFFVTHKWDYLFIKICSYFNYLINKNILLTYTCNRILI